MKSLRTLFVCSFLVLSLLGRAGEGLVSFEEDSVLLRAYLANTMEVWKSHIDTASVSEHSLAYEYGYCGALMETDPGAAKTYVRRFHTHIEEIKNQLPPGHYEMYMSAVYAYEVQLRLSFHPQRLLSLARKAVRLAPDDPMTISYYGTVLFYAPRPLGSKKEALKRFLRAEELFRDGKWYNCWWKPAAMMYIAQCYAKKGNKEKAREWTNRTLDAYPDFLFLRDFERGIDAVESR